MKDDLAYIEHILGAISKIQEYSIDLTKDQFVKNDMVVDARQTNP